MDKGPFLLDFTVGVGGSGTFTKTGTGTICIGRDFKVGCSSGTVNIAAGSSFIVDCRMLIANTACGFAQVDIASTSSFTGGAHKIANGLGAIGTVNLSGTTNITGTTMDIAWTERLDAH